MGFYKYPLPGDATLNADKPRGTGIFLAAHSDIEGWAPLPTPLTADQVQQFIAGDGKLYVFGVIQYTDVFGVVRHLKFCGCVGGPELKNNFPPLKTGELFAPQGEGKIFQAEENNNYEF